MALKLNIDVSRMNLPAKVLFSLLPSILIVILAVIILILPKEKKINRLNSEITKQEQEIARDEAKAAMLPVLKVENARLKKRLDELKLQLPEEKEVTGLLKQVSDLGIKSGLNIILWKPEQKKGHPSGMIYEIPVSIKLSGSYHNLGIFFSSLTRLNRIVNISDIKLASPKARKDRAMLDISFIATTFSAIPEAELQAASASGKKSGRER